MTEIPEEEQHMRKMINTNLSQWMTTMSRHRYFHSHDPPLTSVRVVHLLLDALNDGREHPLANNT